MKKYFILYIIAIFLASGCGQKSKPAHEDEGFFPVLSYIKSQVAQVDTSLYGIKKIIWLDSIRTDTVYLKREEFRNLAKDFLEIPDLSDKKYASLYTEEKFYDEGLNRVVLTCKPKKPDEAIIQRQEVLITPDPSGDKVSNFIIDLSMTSKGSSLQKKLLWQVDHSFQVVTSVQKHGQAETTSIMKVIWKDEKENE
ncbi:MAG TPA: hypothetical protein VET23_14710 [Chitinophagaceae bacterium]|nr:hypothetical protein [Chitinophagaceae bacterium]